MAHSPARQLARDPRQRKRRLLSEIRDLIIRERDERLTSAGDSGVPHAPRATQRPEGRREA